jgi:cytochrome c oxidase subunit II
MLTGSSPFSDFVDTTFLIIVGLSALVFLGIIITMVVFTVRYSRKRNPRPANIEGNLKLEITWTIIPLLLFMGIFYLGWRGYIEEQTIPENGLEIRVTGRMWKWSFEYPDGILTDTLYVPVGVPVVCKLRSVDVNHSFFIPVFRIKKDAIPNRENVMWFKTARIASYDVACAEYCGLEHSYMYTKIMSLDSVSFEKWHEREAIKQTKEYRKLSDLLKQDGK